MKKLFSYALMSLFLIGLLAACGQGGSKDTEQTADNTGSDVAEKKILKMGTSADFPPFEFVDTAKGEDIIGFDIDLANAITEKLGYEIEIQDMDFAGLIEALKSNRVDIVLSGMSATDERKESVDFSDIYYSADQMIVFKKDAPLTSVEELAGKTVGVQTASIQEDKAKEIKETTDIKIDSRNRVPEIIQELKAGRFDAVILEDAIAKGYLDKNQDLAGFTLEGDEENGFAIAFPKGKDELVAEFNKVIAEMKENGELEQLAVKWFGGEQ
ncbi:L-arginine-binding protein [Schinkia azotoformans MEV2011]|uniref:L-arginine-binding protein n=1 Tax=Schinkia azotoformans MEV2011 TaxID=1348973 RepID=A0A072NKB1_SCHAZ|nr:transporter substrate-binding domain-containing protein [Schinkia azotoformans]KEF37378.1 L-arginine-binding protein [Schinkia azotoformans MEV2011]MEC1694602.1 transporter substrate-binding domain-containing protein [Schinkia azotoformans]MEC1718364.1 transporter substrate-binding domain-containing protein [Schinkia azotoformans]MEC1725663.1 transporter substrate-binding domain-containing protein [Schinkia azotoformans]MEC1742551.1 transporter substrate-binding domain-containing protein [S